MGGGGGVDCSTVPILNVFGRLERGSGGGKESRREDIWNGENTESGARELVIQHFQNNNNNHNNNRRATGVVC